MKKQTLIVTLIIGTMVGGVSAEPTPTPTSNPAASPGPGCKASSWNPEQYSFYGAKDTIVEKLANIPVDLSQRRVFLEVTQGESKADVRLFEQQENGTFVVTEWTTKQVYRLLADINKAIVANKGVNCVGEQVKAILAKELREGKIRKGVAAPASPKAAFAHSVMQASGDFIQGTFIILC